MSRKRPGLSEKENDAFDTFTVYTPDRPFIPPPKQPRRSLPDTLSQEFQAALRKAQQECQDREQREVESKREAAAAEARRTADIEALAAAQKLRNGLDSLRENGYDTINDFLTALYTTPDPHLSSTVTKLIDKHGLAHLEAMENCSPELVRQWTLDKVMKTISEEGRRLAQEMCPERKGAKLTATLEQWTLEATISKAKEVAPTILELLRCAGTRTVQDTVHRDHDLVHLTCHLFQWRVH